MRKMVSGKEAGIHIVYLTTEFTIDNFHCGGDWPIM